MTDNYLYKYYKLGELLKYLPDEVVELIFKYICFNESQMEALIDKTDEYKNVCSITGAPHWVFSKYNKY